jgi:hypothetical protein
MLKVYKLLKEHKMDMTVHVTADREHVRFSWQKGEIPGGRIFSFWGLENESPESIEYQLCRDIEDYLDIVKKLEEADEADDPKWNVLNECETVSEMG